MLTVANRGALADLHGKPRAIAPAAFAAPKPDATADAVAGLVAASAQLVQAAQLLATAAQSKPAPKRLEATVHRDQDGRMASVTIDVL